MLHGAGAGSHVVARHGATMGNRYTARPPSNCVGARIAWDLISARDARTIILLWYAPEMDDGTWCAEMSDGEYEEVDVLVSNRYKWNPAQLAKVRSRKGDE